MQIAVGQILQAFHTLRQRFGNAIGNFGGKEHSQKHRQNNHSSHNANAKHNRVVGLG